MRAGHHPAPTEHKGWHGGDLGFGSNFQEFTNLGGAVVAQQVIAYTLARHAHVVCTVGQRLDIADVETIAEVRTQQPLLEGVLLSGCFCQP